MATITQLKDLIAINMGRTTATDLTINAFDYGMYALNAARRNLERSHDFKYAETNVFLSITSSGGLLTACYATSALTGTAIGVKRVVYVSLPVAGTEYLPIEFMTNDEWNARIRRQAGRQSYDSSKTLAQLGVATSNPIAYQHGQTLFLYPSTLTLPITAQLDVTRWMPDYTAGSDTDFFTLYCPEALQWAAILELNKYFRRFIPKQEANVDEESVKTMADAALQSAILWDVSTCRATTTPNAQNPQPAQK